MAKRLDDKTKKKILADYVSCQNYREVARKYNIAVNTVKNIALECTETAQLCTEKAQENTQDVLEYMQTQHETKKRIVVKLLNAIEQKSEKVDMFTNIKDLATAYAIIIDKELKFAEMRKQKEQPEIDDDGFIEALNATAADMDWNGEDFDEE